DTSAVLEKPHFPVEHYVLQSLSCPLDLFDGFWNSASFSLRSCRRAARDSFPLETPADGGVDRRKHFFGVDECMKSVRYGSDEESVLISLTKPPENVRCGWNFPTYPSHCRPNLSQVGWARCGRDSAKFARRGQLFPQTPAMCEEHCRIVRSSQVA